MHQRAIDHLRDREPRFGDWIDRFGLVELEASPRREPYVALLEAIVHQQLAGSAAKAIWNRVIALFEDGHPHPERLMALTEEQMRGAGLSRTKAQSMRDLAAKRLSGHVPDTAGIRRLSEEQIYERLTEIKGIGPWTVDMLMIFTLRRPDIMPINDYGVRKGFQVLYRKRAMPTPKQLLHAAEKWRPYRTAAALYLWRIADATKKPKAVKKAKRSARRIERKTKKKTTS